MHRLVSLFFLLSILVWSIHAGQTGKIAGKVIDKNSQEPLIGSNVSILGTTMGGVTNIDGEFFILNVPAGTYQVKTSYVGYRSVTMVEVKVLPDLTTQLDIALTAEAVELQDVVVVAERKLIQKDITTSTTTMDAEQYQVLPIANFRQAIVLAPGFVSSSNGSGDDGVHVRGGRTGELSYIVDGVRVDDPIYGGDALDISRQGVSSITILSGTFNAEYGQAQSGIINITTPEGSSTYSGNMRYSIGQWDSYLAEASLNGPLPLVGKDRATLFLSADHSFTRTYLNQFTGPKYTSPGGREVQRDFDMKLYNRKIRGNGKFTIKPLNDIKLQIGANISETEYRNYNGYYKAIPDGAGKNRDRGYLYTANLTHTLSPSTFYELKYSYFEKQHNYFLFDEELKKNTPLDQRFDKRFAAVTGGMIPLFDSTSNYEFAGWYAKELWIEDAIHLGYTTLAEDLVDDAGVLLAHKGDILTSALIDTAAAHNALKASVVVPSMSGYYEDNSAIARTYSAQLTSQADQYNLVKAGIEVKYFSISNLWIDGVNSYWDHIDKDLSKFWTRHYEVSAYTFDPIQLSAFVQDKIEFSDFILQIGARLDYLDSDAPDVYSIINDPAKKDSIAKTTVPTKMHISPRIGFAHPITEKIKFRFSYGQFYKFPEFDFLYKRFNQLDATYPYPNLAQGYEPYIGNPNLKPEITHAYEFSGEFELSDDMAGSLTLYYKDTYDYISTARIDADPYAYTQLVNLDYANSRGFEIVLRKRMSNHFAFQINYTFSKAEGNSDYWATHADEAYNASVTGVVPPKRTLTLSWDQPHTLNFTASVDYASWGLSFIGQYGSGLPYTPTDARGKPTGETNSGRQPWTGTVDTRAYYKLAFIRLDCVLFADIHNLFDKRNVINVFNDSGKPDYSTNPNVSPENRQRPNWFGQPRNITAGLEIGF